MDKEVRELLEEPFPADLIKSRPGSFGKKLSYLSTATVVERLNDALESGWSFEVLEYFREEDQIIVLGRLSTNGISKTQWGNKAIGRIKETNAIISIGDDFKSATSDALKKCATLLGCGLHLYQDTPKKTQNYPKTPKSVPNRGVNKGASTQTPKKKKNAQTSKPDKGLEVAKKMCMLEAKDKGVLEHEVLTKAFFDTVRGEYKLKEGQQLTETQWDDLSDKLRKDKQFVEKIKKLGEAYYEQEGGE